MRSRLFVLLGALLALLLLAACGSRETAPQPIVTPYAEISAEPTDESEEIVIFSPEPKPEETPVPRPEPTEEPPMVPISVSELPDSLDAFLCTFNSGYVDREGGRSFDSRNCVDVRANLVTQIVNSVPCVDFSLYPGNPPLYHWAGDDMDRSGWTGTSPNFAVFDPEQIEWIAEEIFHLAPSDYRAVLSRSINSGAFYQNKNDAGEDRFFMPLTNTGRRTGRIVYESAVSNGETYEITYDYLFWPREWQACYTATLALTETETGSYWTLYRQNEREELEALQYDPELFARMSGVYTLGDGENAWQTELTVYPDGSFTGHYLDNDHGENGDDYDQVIYYSDFEGWFGSPTRINAYSYRIELGSLSYIDPEPDMIVEEADGWRILYRYSEAVGLDGCQTFYVYEPGAPTYKLPEIFLLWYECTGYLDESALKLPGWGLMNSIGGQGFSS